MAKPERDVPVRDWSKMLSHFSAARFPGGDKKTAVRRTGRRGWDAMGFPFGSGAGLGLVGGLRFERLFCAGNDG
jgi:hypothetical protein